METKRDGGWQYRVRYRGCRVEKRPKSAVEIAAIILSCNVRHYLLHPRALLSEVQQIRRLRRESVETLKRVPVDRSLLADVRFDGRRVIQDRAVPIQERLEGTDTAERRSVLDRCIDCLFECWKQGFCDASYSFADNYGVLDGRVVLIDIGELQFSKETVARGIADRPWLDSYTDQWLPPADRDYLRSKMERRITTGRLDELWGIERSESNREGDGDLR